MKKFEISMGKLPALQRMYAVVDNAAQHVFGEECYVAVVVISRDGTKSCTYSAADADPELFKQAIDLKTGRANYEHNTDGSFKPL